MRAVRQANARGAAADLFHRNDMSDSRGPSRHIAVDDVLRRRHGCPAFPARPRSRNTSQKRSIGPDERL